jgi:alpha-tubulin suppressor-like RCC1 family protein
MLLLGEEITSVACSDKHVVVVANGNKVFSWGRNEDGCLGLGGSRYHLRILQQLPHQTVD